MLIGGILLISAVIAALVCGISGSFASLAWLWVAPLSFVVSVLVLALAAFLYLVYLCSRVDQSIPQDGDDPLYRKVVDLYLESIVPCVRVHVKATGLEKTPKEGRFMLVCNHCSDSDPIILMHQFRSSQLAFISKKENASMFVVGPMMHKVQCQLINRENDKEALKTILKCIKILKEDKASIAAFPEGGILTEDGKLHHFRPGVFKIAQKAKVPIVVCTLHNTLPVMHNVTHFKRSDVELHLLDVIPAEELKDVTTVDIANRVYQLMAAALGPELIADD